MEIVTYVLEGALEHRDSMGNGSVIRPGDVQYMSAGTGVTHSEFNASKKDTVHLYQIWMFPDKQGYKPAYDQKNFSEVEKRGRLRLLASPDGREAQCRFARTTSCTPRFSAPMNPSATNCSRNATPTFK